MQDIFTEIGQTLGMAIPKLVAALAILIIGWIVARAIAAAVGALLRRTDLDDRIVKAIGGDDMPSFESGISKGVYYLLLLFVLVAFFQTLGLTLITEPLNNLLNQVFAYIPQLVAAGILLLVAWIVATILRMLVTKVLDATRLDSRLGAEAGNEDVSISASIGEAVYWLVFLFFLPAVLGALGVQGLLAPVQNLVDSIMGFLPNLLAAGIILAIGWFVAKIVQRIVSNLLAAVGTDKLSERVGLSSAMGEKKLSDLIGMLLFVLILIPVIIGALNALNLDAITAPASDMLNSILAAFPLVFSALAVLGIAYVVGKVVSELVVGLLAGAGFDNILAKLGLGEKPAEGSTTPSQLVGYLIMVGIMLFAALAAATLLGFEPLSALISQFLIFASRIVIGVIIFAVGIYIAGVVAKMIEASNVQQKGLVTLVARTGILVLATAMALRQMGLANEIINLAFGLLLGAIAVAVALAFGLGGRDIAAKQLSDWSASIKSDD